MPITLNGTTGVTYPDGVTQASGVPTASATSGAPLVSNGSVYTQTTPVGVAFGGTGATSNAAAPFAIKGANSDITSLSGLTTPLSAAQGGTGASTLTANNVLLGNGTSALQVVAPGSNGNILTSNGTTWVSSAPAGGGVTSAVAGNGVAVSSSTGAVTFSLSAPSYNSVGSYIMGFWNGATLGSAGSTVSGSSLRTFSILTYSDNEIYQATANPAISGYLSGTWRLMAPGRDIPAPAVGIILIFVRVA